VVVSRTLHAWPTLLKDEESARDNYVLVCNFGGPTSKEREKTGGREGRRDATEREGKRIPPKVRRGAVCLLA